MDKQDPYGVPCGYVPRWEGEKDPAVTILREKQAKDNATKLAQDMLWLQRMNQQTEARASLKRMEQWRTQPKTIGNCFLAAVIAKIRHPFRVKIHTLRNRSCRIHFYWTFDGDRYEFYTPGASQVPYWRNLIRYGIIRKIG